MKPEILIPFTNATCQTLKLMLDIDSLAETVQKTVGHPDDPSRTDVSIGITGDLTGEVLYSFPVETTLEIVKMLSGMELTEIDEFVMSALGEISNIISGNAVTALSASDITCDIAPPEIRGSEGPAAPDGTEYVFSTKIDTSVGDVVVLLKLKMD